MRLEQKIGNLTRISNTQVQLTGKSVVKLGGLYQVLNSPSLVTSTTGIGGLDTGTVANNQLYYVYAVSNGTTTGIVASTSNQKPVGFSRYKKVGAFQTNSAAQIILGFKLNDTGDTDWVSYTPNFGSLGTPIGVDVKWRKSAANIEIIGRWENGTVTSDQAAFTLPLSLSSALSNFQVVGSCGSQGTLNQGVPIVWNIVSNWFSFSTNANWQILAAGTALGTSGFTGVEISMQILGWTAQLDWKDY
jgi:hypothetical protein